MSDDNRAKVDRILEAVVAKYRAKGWTVIRPNSGPNDLITNLGKKYHFVHVPAIHPEPNDMGQFIQNAFSNAATPVVAKTTQKKSRATGETVVGVSLSDANNKTRILV
jgi:hypothetical protein